MASPVGSPPRVGGTQTRAFFRTLLGFTDGPYEARAVTCDDDRFTVHLAAPGLPEAAILVEPWAAGRPFFVRGPALRVSVQGKTIPPEVERALRLAADTRLQDATPSTLARILDEDPETVTVGGRPVAAGDRAPAPSLPEGEFPDRSPDAYADFLARVDVLCQKVISMWLFNPCTLILHGDRECFGPPNLGLSMVMTINAPWDNHVRDIGRPRSAVPRLQEPDPAGLLAHVTDLRERDVILGARDKELAIFDHVFAKDPGLVVFFHACVGVVSGSDVMSIYKQHKQRHHLPVLYFRGGENQDLRDFYREILVDRRLAARTGPPSSGAPAVNLIGYTGQITTDVLGALADLGVEANGVLLPAMDLGAVDRFERASLNVFMPNVDFQDFYDQLREGSRVRETLRLPAPVGVEGTRRWLEAVARAAGREAALEAAWARLFGPRAERWNELRRAARGRSLGFVVRSRELELLLDPAAHYGIPLLEAVTEMGFGLEVFVHVDPDEPARAAQARLDAAHPPDARMVVSTFRSFEEMMRLLSASGCDAIFSNFFFDWRVTSAGKSIFSLQHFEHGVDGAIRTTERLLQLGQTGLYPQYGRYLRRDASGRPLRSFTF